MGRRRKIGGLLDMDVVIGLIGVGGRWGVRGCWVVLTWN